MSDLNDDKSDELLLVDAIKGDQASFGILFDKYKGWLIRVAERRLKKWGLAVGMDAEDFVVKLHQIVSRTVRNFKRKRDDITLLDAFLGYLKKILERLIDREMGKGHARIIRLESSLGSPSGPLDLAEMAIYDRTRYSVKLSQAETYKRLEKCLSQLAPKSRQVIESIRGDGLSYAKTEELTGLRDGQIRYIIETVMPKLRFCMGRASNLELPNS